MPKNKFTDKKKGIEFLNKEKGNDVYQRIPLAYQSLDANACILDVNNAWLEMFGYTRRDVINKPFSQFLTEECSENFEDNFSIFVKVGGYLGDDLEMVDKKKNIHRIAVDGMVDFYENGKFERTRCFLRDITLEYNAEMELHRLSARNSALLGSVPEIIMEVDNDKFYTWSNQAGLEFFGMNVLGKNAADFFIGNQDLDKRVHRVFKGSEKPQYVESWQRRQDGQSRLLAWWCNTLKDGNGKVKGALSSARDITDSYQKQERINHLNAMLAGIRNVNRLINKERDPRKLLEGVCNNLAGQMGYLSAWGVLFGSNREAVAFVTSSGLEKKAFSALKKQFKQGELPYCIQENIVADVTITKQYHTCNNCRIKAWHEKYDSALSGMITAQLNVKGKVFGLLTVAIPLCYVGDDEVVSLFQEVARDIILAFEKIETGKELKHLRREQLKIGKLESLGVMAGGIAHDFNNLLVGILGNITLAKLSLNSDDEISEYLDSAEIASRRARDLTQQLLTFSKGGSPIKGEVDIATLLKESVKFILRDSSINLKFSMQKLLHKVSGDESQLNQVINNLVLNACEAMPNGGSIKISAENMTIAADSRSLATSENEWDSIEVEYVKIKITDSGIGMNEDLIEKIFDPYFTTKSTGSGLGLSSVFSIIKSHNGMMSVKSKPKKGSTFTILLPALEILSEKEKIAPGKDAELLAHTKILIMDDEVLVRNVLSGFLHSFNCKITTTGHGDEAVSVFKKSMAENPFDIVILDLSIPGKMGGIETAEAILKINPKAKIIVSSGYSDDDAIANYKKYGFIATLRKPYTVEELKTILENVLKS